METCACGYKEGIIEWENDEPIGMSYTKEYIRHPYYDVVFVGIQAPGIQMNEKLEENSAKTIQIKDERNFKEDNENVKNCKSDVCVCGYTEGIIEWEKNEEMNMPWYEGFPNQLHYEVGSEEMPCSHGQKTDITERKMGTVQKDNQTKTQNLENITMKDGDKEVVRHMSHLSCETEFAEVAYADIQNKDSDEKNMDYSQAHDQRKVQSLENMSLRDGDKEVERHMIHLSCEAEFAEVAYADIQNKDSVEENMDYAQADPQMKAQNLENMPLRDGDKEVEGHMSHLSCEAEFTEVAYADIQNKDSVEENMDYAQADSQMKAQNLKNIPLREGYKEVEGHMSHLSCEAEFVEMSYADIQNKDFFEENMDYAQADPQTMAQNLKNMPLRDGSKEVEGHISHSNYDAELVQLLYCGTPHNASAEKKMDCARKETQVKAQKLKNGIAECGDERIENVRNWPLDWQAAKREISMKSSEVPNKPKRVSWKIKVEKWFKRIKNRLMNEDGIPYEELN